MNDVCVSFWLLGNVDNNIAKTNDHLRKDCGTQSIRHSDTWAKVIASTYLDERKGERKTSDETSGLSHYDPGETKILSMRSKALSL